MMLRIKARQVADDEGVSEDVFTGTWSWRQVFLEQHGLAFRARTRQGQRTPPDMEAAATEFWASVERVKAELGVSRVYSADQSGISFEYLPRRTVNNSGEKTVWVRCSGKEKEIFTGMFLADSEGNQYTPFFVLRTVPSKDISTAQDNTTVRRGFGARIWKDIHAFSQQTGAQIFGNRCGWWNTALTVEFVDFHFANRSTDEPVLLLLDDFSAHWTEAAADHALDLNVYLLKVPPGLTSVCQPADVSWFGPMKRRLRDEWVQFLMQQLRVYDGRATDAPFQLQPPTRSDAIQWAFKAWATLGSKVVKSGFKCQTKRDEESEPYRDELVE